MQKSYLFQRKADPEEGDEKSGRDIGSEIVVKEVNSFSWNVQNAKTNIKVSEPVFYTNQDGRIQLATVVCTFKHNEDDISYPHNQLSAIIEELDKAYNSSQFCGQTPK